jgi:oligopeptide transport system substrate-binding protein
MTSCKKDDGSDFIFKYDISGNPRTLDPQTAVGKNAEMVITNMFSGLLRVDERGEVTADVASEYEISDDKKVYTFHLRDDVYWFGKKDFSAKVTAYDFVFAFQRLFNPATKSGLAEDFYCIKNAREAREGTEKDISSIGVKAVNDTTLVFTLNEPNPSFPVLLSTPPAFPCNEEFYVKSEGRYGLSADTIPSNGAFYLLRWNFDKYSNTENVLILRRNDKNSEVERVYPYGLNFFINEANPVENFTKGDTASIVLSGDNAVKLIDGGYLHEDYENSTWGIMFGENIGENLRLALAQAINRDEIKADYKGYSKTVKIVPPAVKYGDVTDGNTGLPYNAKKAQEALEREIAQNGKKFLSGLTVVTVDNYETLDYLSYITQQWQAELHFFCNINPVSEAELTETINGGDFDIALVKLTGEYNSPRAFLERFKEITPEIDKAGQAKDTAQSMELYFAAEQKLLSGAVFIPVVNQTEYFFYNKKCRDIVYNPFTGTADYRKAKKM